VWTEKLVAMGSGARAPFRFGSFEAGLSIADQREIEGADYRRLLDDGCCPPRRWLGESNQPQCTTQFAEI
jgi:hypothetical protein